MPRSSPKITRIGFRVLDPDPHSGYGSGLENVLKDSSPLGDMSKYSTTSDMRYYENMRYDMCVVASKGLSSRIVLLLSALHCCGSAGHCMFLAGTDYLAHDHAVTL